jgi:hypothetical protein
VIYHLQEQIAEFVAEIVEVAARDRLGDLIGFLDGVGGDARKILLEVPRAAGAGRAQRRHDIEQTLDVAGRGHGTPKPEEILKPLCRKTPGHPSETSGISTAGP